jgi:hydrogenase-4 component B
MTALGAILVALGILACSALVTAVVGRSDRAALWVGTGGALAACALGGGAALLALLRGESTALRLPWGLPIGELHMALDGLAAFFLLCLFLVGGLAALYGAGYLRGFTPRQRLGPALVFFNLLLLSMAGVLLSRDGVLFVMAWEIMSMASFFLVTFEHHRAEVRRAGLTYLIASHLGVAFVLMLFLILAAHTGSFDFDGFAAAAGTGALPVSLCFGLALLGFGSKAGFWPLHIWLPDAHPAAPSHVSAVMSGVMIKLGIYGLLRTLQFLGTPPPWWGLLLIGGGILSGLTGVLHALAQQDCKRFLAYSSVENIGIVALGLGAGLLGQAFGQPLVAWLGFTGALLHVLNHGLFKGLLFQAAGSVLHATGTRDIELLGGLAKKMPRTGLAFLIGALAICGLPPLNGFVGEWLIYLGALRGGSSLPLRWAAVALAIVPILALLGGIALAAFVKVFGVVFLGTPRSTAGADAHESPVAMQAAMAVGGGLCLAGGLWPAAFVRVVACAVQSLAPGLSFPESGELPALTLLSRAGIALLALIAALAWLRRLLLRGREVRTAATWGCGYALPTPRMQYTGASFGQPLLAPFASLLHRHVRSEAPADFFPERARHEERMGDLAGERLLVPAGRWVVAMLSRFRVLQQGRIQIYLAYVFVTLILLLSWQLGGGGR